MATFVEQIKDFSAAVLVAVGNRILPAGGTTGQVLVKKSNADYDDEWQTLNFASSSLVEAARIRGWFL